MITNLIKTPGPFALGGQWLVITTSISKHEQSRAYPIENFDGALQYAVGYASNDPHAVLQLDVDAIKELEAR